MYTKYQTVFQRSISFCMHGNITWPAVSQSYAIFNTKSVDKKEIFITMEMAVYAVFFIIASSISTIVIVMYVLYYSPMYCSVL